MATEQPFSRLFCVIIMISLLNICDSCQNGTKIWSSGQRYWTNVTECFYVSNETEIIDIINRANTLNASVRVTGKSHSRSSVNMMDNNRLSFMINMSEYMNNIISFDAEQHSLTFEAGASLWTVLTELETHSLSLNTFVSGPPLSLNFVGCMITGSHSRGSLKSPGATLATDVIHLRMIIANGTIIEANSTYNSDIFNAERISFGALGIITQVTVKGKPIFNVTKYLDERINIEDTDSVLPVFTDLVMYNLTGYIYDYNTFFSRYYFFEQYMTLNDVNIFNDSYQSNVSCWPNNLNTDIVCSDIYYKAMSWGLPNWDKLSSIHGPPEFCMYVNAGLYQEVWLGIIEWFEQQQNDNTKLYKDMKDIYDNGNGYDISFDVRFVKADNIWLSPAFNRTVFQIGMHFFGHPEKFQYQWTNAIREYLKNNFNPITYHWGKQSMATYCDLDDAYPMLHEFIDLREELDPNGIFLNNFIIDKLGLCDIDVVNGCCCTNTSCKVYLDNDDDNDWFNKFWNDYGIVTLIILVIAMLIVVIMCCVCKKCNKQKEHERLNEISMQPNDYMAASDK